MFLIVGTTFVVGFLKLSSGVKICEMNFSCLVVKVESIWSAGNLVVIGTIKHTKLFFIRLSQGPRLIYIQQNIFIFFCVTWSLTVYAFYYRRSRLGLLVQVGIIWKWHHLKTRRHYPIHYPIPKSFILKRIYDLSLKDEQKQGKPILCFWRLDISRWRRNTWVPPFFVTGFKTEIPEISFSLHFFDGWMWQRKEKHRLTYYWF